VLKSKHRSNYSGEKSPRYPLDRRLGGVVYSETSVAFPRTTTCSLQEYVTLQRMFKASFPPDNEAWLRNYAARQKVAFDSH
jgi:hypothetical protein